LFLIGVSGIYLIVKMTCCLKKVYTQKKKETEEVPLEYIAFTNQWDRAIYRMTTLNNANKAVH